MILTVNVGNTNINGGLFPLDGGQPVCLFRFPTAEASAPEDVRERIRSHFPENAIPTGSALASVVPSKAPLLALVLESLVGAPPLILLHPEDTGIDLSGYDSSLVGMDRLVGCAGAMERYPLPLAVFDLGTATTVSVLDEKGSFRGGAILAGVQMGLDALAAGTSLLPETAIRETPPVIGRNTAECLAAGAVFGAAGALDGYAAHLEAELCSPLALIATGGNAPAILPHCKTPFIHDPDLLQRGLLHLYRVQIPTPQHIYSTPCFLDGEGPDVV